MDELKDALQPGLQRNQASLRKRFRRELTQERAILDSPDLDAFDTAYLSWRHTANDRHRSNEVGRLAANPRSVPFRLFTLSFAWGYFGLAQAIEIDSIRFAIHDATRRRAVDAEQGRWALLALMQAVSCVASTPGHFAQYLNASTDKSLRRVIAQRRRPMWDQFLAEWEAIKPYGASDWRATNRVMRQNALTIWPTLRRHGFRDGIIYADPPYSKDHYSRYYHVLDTLVRYDYPAAVGAGRYRPDRFATPFSRRTEAPEAFDRLFRGVARTGSVMLLSYPTSGLIRSRNLERALEKHFDDVELALCTATDHSTLGSRHGLATNRVRELVYVAKP